MGLVSEAVVTYDLTCDRCHRTYDEDSEADSAEKLALDAEIDGWAQRKDPTCKGPVEIWLCPKCLAEVRIEQGEEIVEGQPS